MPQKKKPCLDLWDGRCGGKGKGGLKGILKNLEKGVRSTYQTILESQKDILHTLFTETKELLSQEKEQIIEEGGFVKEETGHTPFLVRLFKNKIFLVGFAIILLLIFFIFLKKRK